MANAPHTDKETPAQRVERVKRERAPWSILDDIRRYAREGFASIPPDDLNIRFRAWGLYTQGDGHGTRGKEEPYFMMRVRTPNGLVTSEMVRVIAGVATRYARGTIDVTNRQNFQLHWLRIEDIPAVWDALARVGWTSQGACGDNTRTVTGCPLAGVAHDEILDASPYAVEIDRFLNGNAEYGNLPRKFKITVTGCAHWCTYPEINDIGVTATRMANGAPAFEMRVGGGLSTRPHLAVRLPALVLPEQLREVVVAAVGIFRDSDELRVNRAKARMKFLFVNHGWTAERFLAEIERRIGHALIPSRDGVEPPRAVLRDHVGVHPQQQDDLYFAGFSIPSGRVTPTQLLHLADLATQLGDGTLRLTVLQNIVVLNVPRANIDRLLRDAAAAGLGLGESAFTRGTVSCTGSEFCKLAITETKQFSIELAHNLQAAIPDLGSDLKLHVTGCPNSCGQHWIADIGLQGVLLNRGDAQVEGFDVFFGGAPAAGRIARRLGVRLAADDVQPALTRLFRSYADEREGTETFGSWVSRVPEAELKRRLGAT